MSPRKAKFLIFPLPQEHPVISGVRNPIKFYLHTSKSRSYRSKPKGIQTLKNRDLSAPDGMSPRSLVLFFLFGSFFFRFFLVQILVLKIIVKVVIKIFQIIRSQITIYCIGNCCHSRNDADNRQNPENTVLFLFFFSSPPLCTSPLPEFHPALPYYLPSFLLVFMIQSSCLSYHPFFTFTI